MSTSWPAAGTCQHSDGRVNNILIVKLNYNINILLGGTFNGMKEGPKFRLL
jgi:hypothetical protein